MNISSEPPKGSPYDLPSWLKRIHDWWKALAVVAVGGGYVIGYLLNQDSTVSGVIFAFSFGVVYFSIRIIAKALGLNPSAEGILAAVKPDAENYQQAQQALKELRQSGKFARQAIVALLVMVVATIAILLYRPVSQLFRKARPQELVFDSIDYFDPTRQRGLVRDSPFLEAVIAYLKDEGKAEKRPTGIVLGTTKPVEHPTPPFKLSVAVDHRSQVLTGYGFRLQRLRQRLVYEPVPVSYARGSVDFLVPPCDQGDRLFFLGRISLTAQNASFPANPKDLLEITVSEAQR